jgi:hypothetical protein
MPLYCHDMGPFKLKLIVLAHDISEKAWSWAISEQWQLAAGCDACF